ncbi:hypothetical protein FACS1894217_11000 [Clostridia bacterium]|nr:hypothetical protein FACS1894217_11000 [Clostridia bacterium]
MRFKKLLALILALTIIVGACPLFASAANTPVNDRVELGWYAAQAIDGGKTSLGISTPSSPSNIPSSWIESVGGLTWRNISGYSYSSWQGEWTLTPRFSETTTMAAACVTKANSVVASVIKSGMTRREKYKALHDWVVNNTVYDLNAPNAGQSAYNSLVGGRAVCNGYAKAFMLLCRTAGLPCVFVTGTAWNSGGGGGHAWNMVIDNGQWLFVDTTWDDPLTSNGQQVLRDDYFMLTASQIAKDHSASLTTAELDKLSTLGFPDRDDMADVLYAYGLFKGTGSGYELLKTAPRVDGGTMFSRILGYDEAALPASTPKAPFTDIPAWAAKTYGNLYALNLVQGVGGNKYDAGRAIPLGDYCTFVLRGLGYSSGTDFNWQQSTDKAVSLGILTSAEAAAIKLRGFKRGDMVLLSYNALNTKLKGSNSTLYQTLDKKGVIKP